MSAAAPATRTSGLSHKLALGEDAAPRPVFGSVRTVRPPDEEGAGGRMPGVVGVAVAVAVGAGVGVLGSVLATQTL